MVQAYQLGARRRRPGTALSSGSAVGALVTCHTAGSRLPTSQLYASRLAGFRLGTGLSSTPPRATFLPVDAVPRPILLTIVTARAAYLWLATPLPSTSGAAPTRRRGEVGAPGLARSKLRLARCEG